MIITISSIFADPLPEFSEPWSLETYAGTINRRSNPMDMEIAIREVYTPAIVRKAYLSVVRYVHPDKIGTGSSVYVKLLSMKVFTALTDAYNIYKNSV